jgi:hypothetical protein
MKHARRGEDGKVIKNSESNIAKSTGKQTVAYEEEDKEMEIKVGDEGGLLQINEDGSLEVKQKEFKKAAMAYYLHGKETDPNKTGVSEAKKKFGITETTAEIPKTVIQVLNVIRVAEFAKDSQKR